MRCNSDLSRIHINIVNYGDIVLKTYRYSTNSRVNPIARQPASRFSLEPSVYVVPQPAGHKAEIQMSNTSIRALLMACIALGLGTPARSLHR